MNPSDFSAADREAVYQAIHRRRDMRHFAGGEVAPEVLQRLLEAAHAAPSVGLSQPWRFLRITDTRLRSAIHVQVQAEVQHTAAALADREQAFLQLKVEGVLDCAELLVACVHDAGPGTEIFGRRTMPAQMSLASVACAIQNLWLAARAENRLFAKSGWNRLWDQSSSPESDSSTKVGMWGPYST